MLLYTLNYDLRTVKLNSAKPISITLNGNPAYRLPYNAGYSNQPLNNNPQQKLTNSMLGTPFLQVAFLTIVDSMNNGIQGIELYFICVYFGNLTDLTVLSAQRCNLS